MKKSILDLFQHPVKSATSKQQPNSSKAAEFVGEGALISGIFKDLKQIGTGLGLLAGDFNQPLSPQTAVRLLIRPEDVIHDGYSSIKAQVLRRNFRGANILYHLLLENGEQVQALVPSPCVHQPDEKIGILPNVRELVVFPF